MAFKLGDEEGFRWVGAYEISADELLDGKAGKQYSIKRMMGGRVIEENIDFYRYLICHLPSASV